MRNLGGNPHGTMWRNNPCAISGADRHHPARGIDKLISMMEVQSDDVAGWIVVGERCDCRLRIARPIANSTLALLRHRLSLYRKRAQLGNRYAVNQLAPFREEHEPHSS